MNLDNMAVRFHVACKDFYSKHTRAIDDLSMGSVVILIICIIGGSISYVADNYPKVLAGILGLFLFTLISALVGNVINDVRNDIKNADD